LNPAFKEKNKDLVMQPVLRDKKPSDGFVVDLVGMLITNCGVVVIPLF
jgi:hypothetical protein